MFYNLALRPLFITCLAVATAACGTSAAPHVQTVDLGTEFTLSPSAKAAVKGAGMEMQFVGISEDSRCPSDATCVWAGQVKVNLSVSGGQQAASSHEILEGETAAVDGYQVKVVRVLPYPATSTPIPPADYRVTLQVAKN
jgi:hypothetical protein